MPRSRWRVTFTLHALPGAQPWTEALLGLCEERLAIAATLPPHVQQEKRHEPSPKPEGKSARTGAHTGLFLALHRKATRAPRRLVCFVIRRSCAAAPRTVAVENRFRPRDSRQARQGIEARSYSGCA